MHHDIDPEIKCFLVVMYLKVKNCQGARRQIVFQAGVISFLQLTYYFLTHYVISEIIRKDF